MSVLLPLCYFPPVSWFEVSIKAVDACLEAHEHYTKGTYRNRCHIATANGVQLLTVPLRKGKHQQQLITEVKLAYDEPWQLRHWRAIASAYGNSPFFEHFADKLEPFYRDKNHETLWEWNLDLLNIIASLLKKEIRFCATSQFEQQPMGIKDLRNAFEAKLSQPEWAMSIKYPQVFEDRLGFVPNLSILDLLFCVGKWPD